MNFLNQNKYNKTYKTFSILDMSKEQRLEHIDDCKVLIDKQKTFYFRLTLASKNDPEAADMKERINALSNAFGFKDLMDCMDCMIKTLEDAAKRG